MASAPNDSEVQRDKGQCCGEATSDGTSGRASRKKRPCSGAWKDGLLRWYLGVPTRSWEIAGSAGLGGRLEEKPSWLDRGGCVGRGRISSGTLTPSSRSVFCHYHQCHPHPPGVTGGQVAEQMACYQEVRNQKRGSRGPLIPTSQLCQQEVRQSRFQSHTSLHLSEPVFSPVKSVKIL